MSLNKSRKFVLKKKKKNNSSNNTHTKQNKNKEEILDIKIIEK